MILLSKYYLLELINNSLLNIVKSGGALPLHLAKWRGDCPLCPPCSPPLACILYNSCDKTTYTNYGRYS